MLDLPSAEARDRIHYLGNSFIHIPGRSSIQSLQPDNRRRPNGDGLDANIAFPHRQEGIAHQLDRPSQLYARKWPLRNAGTEITRWNLSGSSLERTAFRCLPDGFGPDSVQEACQAINPIIPMAPIVLVNNGC